MANEHQHGCAPGFGIVENYHDEARRTDLSNEEALRAANAILSQLSLLEASFHSAQEGIITEPELNAMMAAARLWTVPFISDSWHIWRNELGPDFVSYFEGQHPGVLASDASAE